jgi:hypothetical protein
VPGLPAGPDGYCREHPEFYVVKAPVPEPELERGEEDDVVPVGGKEAIVP